MISSNLEQETIGVIIVDHGSRRRESNDMLLNVVAMFERLSDWSIIEPAHMEIAEPSIADAFDRCVERGATTVVVHPYFLLPGKHWHEDIPQLTEEAGKKHPEVKHLVTAPLGLHDLMSEVMDQRIRHCLACAGGQAEPCEMCRETGHEQCRFAEA